MAGCLEMLGVAKLKIFQTETCQTLRFCQVHTQPDYMNFLHDERCWGVDCGNKAAVAFHSLLNGRNTFYLFRIPF